MRRPHDQYFTPASACEVLQRYWDGSDICDLLIEPCAGSFDIVDAFGDYGRWTTCDIDPAMKPGHVADMTLPESWESLKIKGTSAVITNPPYNCAFQILKNAHRACTQVAMLLRLSFLEPTRERGPWLAANPPDLVIVLPRISFTGDGKTDSVTCAWMIWDKAIENKGVIVSPKTEPAYSHTAQASLSPQDLPLPDRLSPAESP